MSVSRELLDILTTPGYVSLIEGRPGTGKTTLALMACARHGRCTYISYAEPEASVKGKLESIDPKFGGQLRFINALSGSPGDVFSTIGESASRGELVVVDTVDAMLYDASEGLRALLQLLYGSVKEKQGSLVLISEGLSPASPQLRFISDAIVRVYFEEVLGEGVRAVRLLKDRDRPIDHPRHYMTFADMSILEPFPLLERPRLGRLSSVKLPPYEQIRAQLETGPRVLVELDMSVSDLRARLLTEFMAAYYLKNGYSVDYIVGPNEHERMLMEDVERIAGESARNLRIIKADARSSGFSAERHFEKIVGMAEKGAVHFVNLLAEEDFAVNAPLEYENFIYMITKYNVDNRQIVITYGNSALRATEIQRKYANIIRKYAVTDGFLFWRSVKPVGPVHFVRMEPEKGRIEFVRMM